MGLGGIVRPALLAFPGRLERAIFVCKRVLYVPPGRDFCLGVTSTRRKVSDWSG
jgi:hypothetical protein